MKKRLLKTFAGALIAFSACTGFFAHFSVYENSQPIVHFADEDIPFHH
ncbi:hypothetical protein [Bacillus marinisedimentorum]|nr:hypothetical protein [Bacillus marinisedimentorum]